MTKVAVITGAGSGIGRAVSIELIQSGYKVVLAGRTLEKLGQTRELAAASDQALVLATDVTKPDSVDHLFDRTIHTFGRVDVLFNNAGQGSFATSFDEIDYEQWRRVMDVNITGMFLCAKAAYKAMRYQTPQGGRIINNGSISAHTPRPLSAPYTTSKHAITGLTKSISLDGRVHNVVCSQIDIGNAGTEMTDKISKGILQANGQLMAEPTMDVNHIAQTVRFMADLPLESNMQFVTVMATKMPFIGRG